MRFDRLGVFLAHLFGLRPGIEPAGRPGLPSRVFRRAARPEGERLRSFGDRRLRRMARRARRQAEATRAPWEFAWPVPNPDDLPLPPVLGHVLRTFRLSRTRLVSMPYFGGDYS